MVSLMFLFWKSKHSVISSFIFVPMTPIFFNHLALFATSVAAALLASRRPSTKVLFFNVSLDGYTYKPTPIF